MTDEVTITRPSENSPLTLMPKTLGAFMDLCDEMGFRKKTSSTPLNHANPVQKCKAASVETNAPAEDLDEIALAILRQTTDGAISSDAIADKLEVSSQTVRRRYKLLVSHGLIKTAQRKGARITEKGIELLSKLGNDQTDIVSIVTETDDSAVAI